MITLTQDQRNRLIITAVATLVALAAIWFGLIRLQLKSRVGYRAAISQAEAKLKESERLVHSSDRFAQELAAQRAGLEEIESGMAPAGQAYAWMIRTVNKFKEPYKADIPNFSSPVIGEVGLLPAFPYQAANCTVRGTAYFHELGRFIADFENAFPYLRIQNFDLMPLSGVLANEDQEKLEFKCDLVALISKSNPTP
jgi:hypothetical protein